MTPTYETVHARLRAAHGKASEHECEDCGEQADHWSYDNGHPEEIIDAKGRRYTLDLTAYAPRCPYCHYNKDAAFGAAVWDAAHPAPPPEPGPKYPPMGPEMRKRVTDILWPRPAR